MNLIPDIWIGYLIGDKEEFFNDDAFLADGVDLSYTVENDYVNFAYKGTDIDEGDIVEDFVTDGDSELETHVRTDTAEKYKLKAYSTPQLVIPYEEMQLLPYDKKVSMMDNARDAVRRKIATRGIYDIAPVNSAKTPVISIPSGNTNGGDGYKQVTRADFITLRKLLDAKYPGLIGRNYKAIVDIDTYWDLVNNDSILAAQYANQVKAGDILNTPMLSIANFIIMADNRTAGYTSVSAKLAFGATFTPGTHLKSVQVYFPKKTFATALGSTKLFSNPDDAGKQADVTSFRTRAYAGPWGETASNFKHAAAILRIPNT